QRLARARIVYWKRRRSAKDARAERDDDVGAVDDRSHLDAVLGATVFFGDDAVLRDVDETAREVARVRGLQRGVREALTGAVGRVEVFENRKTFLEVRDNRRLDDFARGLRHQAAHAGELLHPVLRTTRTRMRQHEDGVEFANAAVSQLGRL